jgi:creatinine amidohydrolase
MSRHLLSELTRVTAAQRAESAVAVLPIGATEQHGPHLPLGTDTILVTEIATRAAALAGDSFDVVVAPTLPIGFSPHHSSIGATLTWSSPLVAQALHESCASLVDAGFTKVFVLNGHGGNAELVTVAARRTGVELGIEVGAGTYWVIAWEGLVSLGVHPGGHAGVFETSLMQHLRPELIGEVPIRTGVRDVERVGQRPSFYRESPDTWSSIEGFTDDPSLATAALGSAYLDVIVEAVATSLSSF